MFFISHRGNIDGKNSLLENSASYIKSAIEKGFDVEVDVWFVGEEFYLGHDKPTHPIDIEFLQNSKLWCHAKNIRALCEMLKNKIHCFWHEKDTVTLTSKGFIWAYPGKQKIPGSIAVLPEIYDDDIDDCIGVCSDYINLYKIRTIDDEG